MPSSKRRRRRGRPTKLEQLDLTIHDIEQLYLKHGSYRGVSEETGITERTLKKYLKYSRIDRPVGPRRGKYSRHFAAHPDDQNLTIREIADKTGFDYEYLRRYIKEKRREQETDIKASLRQMLRNEGQLVTQDGRRVPIKAIRRAVIRRWRWGEPVVVEFLMRNGVRIRYEYPYTPEL